MLGKVKTNGKRSKNNFMQTVNVAEELFTRYLLCLPFAPSVGNEMDHKISRKTIRNFRRISRGTPFSSFRKERPRIAFHSSFLPSTLSTRVQCSAMQCNAILQCNGMLQCYALQCNAIQYHNTVRYNAMIYNTTTMQCDTMQSTTIQQCHEMQ